MKREKSYIQNWKGKGGSESLVAWTPEEWPLCVCEKLNG